MPIRITGMNSGLDTESIITALTQSKKDKVDTHTGDQKKLSWKQDKWKALNKKVVNFYNGALSTMRFSTAYTKKTTTASNSNAVTVVTGDNAMNATQTMSVDKLAKAAYLTGGKVETTESELTKNTNVSALSGFTAGDIDITVGDKKAKISVADSDTIGSVLDKIKNAKFLELDEESGEYVEGKEAVSSKLDINFDEKNGRFFVSAKETGAASNFEFSGNPVAALGLSKEGEADEDGNTKNYIAGSSAQITLNGVEYTSDNNTFEINGLTITANEVTTSAFTLTTKQDTSGIYDNVKKLIKEYNDLMKEFSTLYNADAAKKYKMLTDDQKDAMTDTEVEEWENKIKEGLLSKDETIGTVRNALQTIVASSITIGEGDNAKSYSLASFGIATGSYFSTEENERDVLHIDGDPDDDVSSGNTDILKAMIASDPDAVMNFFTEFSKNMYGKISDLMKGTEYSSAFTIYEDKLMASQYSAYNTKISDAQKALEAAQDKLYKKFATMESALSKINSSSSSLSGFFGTGG